MTKKRRTPPKPERQVQLTLKCCSGVKLHKHTDPPAPDPDPKPKPPPPPPHLPPAATLCVVAAAAIALSTWACPREAHAFSPSNAFRDDTRAAAAHEVLNRPRQRIAARQQALLELRIHSAGRVDRRADRRHARAARRQRNAAPAAAAPDEPPRPFRALMLRIRFPLAEHNPPTRLHELRRRRRADRRHSDADEMAPPPDETAPMAPPAGRRPN